ncbi:lauroyl acyltransferase, partial [Campylobacter jejuni]|nr:lauroyl acyltransferase [Campylobacter jejuni]
MKNSDRIYLSLYYILKFFVTFMPDCILHFLALIVARITFHLNKKHRKIIDTNL